MPQLLHEMQTLSFIYSWYLKWPNQNALLQAMWGLTWGGLCQQPLAWPLAPGIRGVHNTSKQISSYIFRSVPFPVEFFGSFVPTVF